LEGGHLLADHGFVRGDLLVDDFRKRLASAASDHKKATKIRATSRSSMASMGCTPKKRMALSLSGETQASSRSS
jgi:hypothetical protein